MYSCIQDLNLKMALKSAADSKETEQAKRVSEQLF
jgi:hypothetical protein